MTDILWGIALLVIGFVVGFIAGKLLFLSGYGDAYAEGHACGKAEGHAIGFAQGRAVSAKAINR